MRNLYAEFGQRKVMGLPATSTRRPHYFLLRTFLRENDLLIILNTKRCRYQCHFCELPAKSSRAPISSSDILAQVELVVDELRHALSVLDRVTLSNDGSVLDAETLPPDTLLQIAAAVGELRRVRTFALETRLEFVNAATLGRVQALVPRAVIDILTGFETQDPHVRDTVLVKREPMALFLSGLDVVGTCGAHLTAYVLFKPDPGMSDSAAMEEAERSIDFLVRACGDRRIPLTIRLNPMYLARGSRWGERASGAPHYAPPKLTDVMRLAERKRAQGVRLYIGISSEGLDGVGGTYQAREDFSAKLIGPVKAFNDERMAAFDWTSLAPST